MKKKWKIVCIIALIIYTSSLTTYFFLKTNDEWFVLNTMSNFYPCQNQQLGAIEANNANILFASDKDLGVRTFNTSNFGDWEEFGSLNHSYYYLTQFALTDQYLFLTQYTNLIVVNITNPSNLTQVAIFPTTEILWDVVIYQSYAFITGYQMLYVLDISNITHISVIEERQLFPGEHALSLWGDYLYVANFMQGIYIYRVAENGTLNFQNRFENYGRPDTQYVLVESAVKVFASEKYLFVLDEYHSLVICNRSDPNNPRLLSYRFATSRCSTITFDGRFLILADNTDGIRIIDLMDPLKPQTIILDRSQGDCFDVKYINGKIYALTSNGVGTFQIVPGLGRNPSLVLEAINVIIGIVGSTLAILLMVYIIYLVKKSEILE